MENNLEIDIKESIRKNLPEQVGAVLTEQLNNLRTLEEAHLSRTKEVEQRNQTIASLRSQVESLEQTVRKAGGLEKRENEIREREITATIEELQTKLVAEEKISNSYFQFVTGLVKNTGFKESVYKSITTGTDYNNSGTTIRYPISESVNTTREAE